MPPDQPLRLFEPFLPRQSLDFLRSKHRVVKLHEGKMQLRDNEVLIVPWIADDRRFRRTDLTRILAALSARQVIPLVRAVRAFRDRKCSGPVGIVEVWLRRRPGAVDGIQLEGRGPEVPDGLRVVLPL